MKTKANWGKRPTSKKPAAPPSVDEFVNGTGQMAKLNCLIPKELHTRVKLGCVAEGTSMTDVVISFLEGRFPKK